MFPSAPTAAAGTRAGGAPPGRAGCSRTVATPAGGRHGGRQQFGIRCVSEAADVLCCKSALQASCMFQASLRFGGPCPLQSPRSSSASWLPWLPAPWTACSTTPPAMAAASRRLACAAAPAAAPPPTAREWLCAWGGRSGLVGVGTLPPGLYDKGLPPGPPALAQYCQALGVPSVVAPVLPYITVGPPHFAGRSARGSTGACTRRSACLRQGNTERVQRNPMAACRLDVCPAVCTVSALLCIWWYV